MSQFATTAPFRGGLFLCKSLSQKVLPSIGNWHFSCNVYLGYFHMEAKSVAAPRYRTTNVRIAVMERIRQSEISEQEPIGIIISRGSRTEEPPRFSAYVWGPVRGMEYPVEEGKPVAA